VNPGSGEKGYWTWLINFAHQCLVARGYQSAWNQAAFLAKAWGRQPFRIIEQSLYDNDRFLEDQAKKISSFWRFDSFKLPRN
jgi:hypothetical protein